MTAPSCPLAAATTSQAALRILFIIPGDARGSSMVFARRQAQSLIQEGVSIDIFHLRSRTSPARLAGEWVRFRRQVRQFRPQVLHAHFGTVTALFTVLAAGRLPVVITYRGSDLNRVPTSAGMRSWLGRLMSQLAAFGAARIVCVSRGLRQRLWWRRDCVTVLASGVDTDLFRPLDRELARRQLGWPEKGQVVLFNAGHDPRNKRLDLAEAAVRQASDTLPGLQMTILNGETDPQLIPQVMNAADCLLVTSDSEGSPTVIQEALATNLPVVSVDTGDAVERLTGVTNSRIAARDPLMLSQALVELTAVPRRSNGRVKAEEFSLRCIAHRLVQIYGELCGERRDEGPRVQGAGTENHIGKG